jgi:glycosyltransferase involved in cell wall biosynthesis
MSRLFLSKLLLQISDWMRPVLKRLLPIAFLRKVKETIISRAMKDLRTNDFVPFIRSAYPDGINLIGDIRGEIGLGQSCRLVAGALATSGLDFAIYHFDQLSAVSHNDHSWDWKITNTTPYNLNIFHISPPDLRLAYIRLTHRVWNERYNIGFWLWELENFPSEWLRVLDWVDEVWTPSEHTGDSIRKITDKPVYIVPYPISAPISEKFNRAYFKLPSSRFLFLCLYDCGSTIERKNPLGAVHAFKLAFSPDHSDVGLVIKINNPQEKDLRLLRSELTDYAKNIYLLPEILDKIQVNSLIACADVYVSLHRAEGFGLVPAEAMLLGTPVVATNWSANTEFMNDGVACMVDFSFVQIQTNAGSYKKGERWADPDVGQAAGFMRRLYEDPVFYKEKSEKAKAFIADKLSAQQAAELIRRRVREIYHSHPDATGSI